MRATLAIFHLFLLASCSSNLPESCPDDLHIRLHDGGGMYPHSENWEIRKDSSSYELFHEDSRHKWKFATHLDSLCHLYNYLREQDIDHIVSEDQGPVYDRGGSHLSMSSKQFEVEVSDAGNMFVKNQHQDRYSSAILAIQRFVASGLKSQEVEVKLELASEIPIDSITYIDLWLEGMLLFRMDEKRPQNTQTRTMVLPGSRKVTGSAKLLGSPSYLRLDTTLAILQPSSSFQIFLSSTKFDLNVKN
jgi:hypothetical protein